MNITKINQKTINIKKINQKTEFYKLKLIAIGKLREVQRREDEIVYNKIMAIPNVDNAENHKKMDKLEDVDIANDQVFEHIFMIVDDLQNSFTLAINNPDNVYNHTSNIDSIINSLEQWSKGKNQKDMLYKKVMPIIKEFAKKAEKLI